MARKKYTPEWIDFCREVFAIKKYKHVHTLQLIPHGKGAVFGTTSFGKHVSVYEIFCFEQDCTTSFISRDFFNDPTTKVEEMEVGETEEQSVNETVIEQVQRAALPMDQTLDKVLIHLEKRDARSEKRWRIFKICFWTWLVLSILVGWFWGREVYKEYKAEKREQKYQALRQRIMRGESIPNMEQLIKDINNN